MRLLTVAAHDARLQFRYGIYLAYGFVIAFYIAVAIWGRPYLPSWAPALVIYTDPAAVGFFFLGALMMLERAEGVRMALSITPLSALDYLAGKVITLTGLALVACAILAIILGEGNQALLLLAVTLTSLAFLGIGIPIALRFRTVSGYLVGSAAFLTPVVLPAFLAMLPQTPIWLYLLPPVAQLRLILVATGDASAAPGELALMLAVAAAAAAGALWWAVRALEGEFGKR